MASIAIKPVTLAAAVMTSVFFLSGCQALSDYQSGYKTIDTPTTPTPPAGKIHSLPGEVTVACEGTFHCEITQIDKIALINTETHSPIDWARVIPAGQVLQQRERTFKTVKLVPLMKTKLDGLINYYARIIPGHREVHVNFYPESNDAYSERFALIHEFTEPGDYRLHAYRITTNNAATSLLDSASPNPLCVELLQDGNAIRRFCKLPVDTRQNEFIEVTGISNGADLEAFFSSDDADFPE